TELLFNNFNKNSCSGNNYKTSNSNNFKIQLAACSKHGTPCKASRRPATKRPAKRLKLPPQRNRNGIVFVGYRRNRTNWKMPKIDLARSQDFSTATARRAPSTLSLTTTKIVIRSILAFRSSPSFQTTKFNITAPQL